MILLKYLKGFDDVDDECTFKFLFHAALQIAFLYNLLTWCSYSLHCSIADTFGYKVIEALSKTSNVLACKLQQVVYRK